MGAAASADTRRISFDNNLPPNPALIQNSIEENIEDVLRIEPIIDNDTNLNFYDDMKLTDTHEGGDTDYWNQRVDTLKKEHQLINKVVETEYEKTVEYVKKNFESPNNLTVEKIKRVKPCLDWRIKIMQCYEENPHQPLVCSGVVEAFTKCVSSCRSPENEIVND